MSSTQLRSRFQKAVENISPPKNKSKCGFVLLRIIAHSACLLLFVCFMVDIYDKFSEKLTNVGIRSQSQFQTLVKELPCVTACPWKPFKRQGLFYNRRMLDQETLEKEEIFLENDLSHIFNRSLFSIDEIRSVIFGRCYRVCHLKPVEKNYEMHVMFKEENEMKGFYLPFLLHYSYY